MDLCLTCSKFDIRALLLHSEEQEQRSPELHNQAFISVNDYREPVPLYFKHQPSLSALRTSAKTGCHLCDTFWPATVKMLELSSEESDEWLDHEIKGQLWIGASGWSILRQGIPYVTLVQAEENRVLRTLCVFEPFIDRANEAYLDVAHLVGRAIYKNSASLDCLATAACWLKTCLRSHNECSVNSDMPVLPTRVIEVGLEGQSPRLVNSNKQRASFIALSYCWGGDSVFVYNDTTETLFRNGVPLKDFPQTLQDAIIITRFLGIAYIWIDAICIKQDSKEDWAREASRMREIYSSALLTIACARSAKTTSGIFAERQPTEDCYNLLSVPGDIKSPKIYLRSGTEIWDNTMRSNPLMTRGWALQEGLLAPRTLSFGKQQMIWECSKHQEDECGRVTAPSEDYKAKRLIQSMLRLHLKTSLPELSNPISLATSLWKRSQFSKTLKASGISTPYKRWWDIVEEFTTRSLTQDTDTLPSLSGIANAFRSVLPPGERYLAGIWSGDILSGLIWTRTSIYARNLPPGHNPFSYNITRPPKYIAPSWSWASLPGGKALIRDSAGPASRDKRFLKEMAEIVDIKIDLKTQDPFGEITGGYLEIQGRFHMLSECPWIPPKQRPDLLVQTEEGIKELEKYLQRSGSSAFEQHVRVVLWSVDWQDVEFQRKHKEAPKQKFAALELIRWKKAPSSGNPGNEFLVLESTGEADDEWRRLGAMSLRYLEDKGPKELRAQYYFTGKENDAWKNMIKADWKRKTVKIV